MLANQRSYEQGLEDLRLVCDSYIEQLKRQIPCEKIGAYLEESDRRNDMGLAVESVRGLATSKEMILTKADMEGVSLSNYKVVLPRQIAYVPDTSRRGDKVSLGFNGTDETFLVSSISTVFGTKLDKLLPEYYIRSRVLFSQVSTYLVSPWFSISFQWSFHRKNGTPSCPCR